MKDLCFGMSEQRIFSYSKTEECFDFKLNEMDRSPTQPYARQYTKNALNSPKHKLHQILKINYRNIIQEKKRLWSQKPTAEVQKTIRTTEQQKLRVI